MRLLPRSIYGRMLLLSALATAAALVIAALAIGQVLERFVISGIDDRLETSITLMRSTIGPDGKADPQRMGELAPIFTAGRGWMWRIDATNGAFGSPGGQWTQDRALPPPPPPDRDHRRGPRRESDRFTTPVDGRLGDGTPFHGRQLVLQTSGGPVTLLATAPRRLVDRPIGQAVVPLLVTLAILGALLAIAAIVQLRLGLRPLTRLRGDVAAIRSGRSERLSDDQPAELAPLTGELNALLADNQAALAAARAGAANLAHGLKTPLATLALLAGEPGRDPDGRLAALVARLDSTVRHHLGRARASIAGGRVTTPVAPVAAEIAEALRRIHAGSAREIAIAIPADLAVAVDRTDLEEMIGNLADNAMRWAATRVEVTAAAIPGMVAIRVSDDGPGIPPDARAQALAHGMRLDESGDGHGFGLAIVRELAGLYGGGLALDDAPGGGLAATLSLPVARAG